MQGSKILWLITALLLLALIPSMPYGYYPVLRWIVCASCIWLATLAHRRQQEAWTWSWAVLAGIYNPIISIHASREVWSVVNIVTIALIATYRLRAMSSNKES
ncbi:DUF6804 family protein [Xanthomonas campestris]|uniref:DUF6804 family protein n=2 Tax=Xanthomonas campestris TaxID=339 RepID=UPI00387E50DE